MVVGRADVVEGQWAAVSDSFTVNVRPQDLYDAMTFVATHSGPDYDRFANCGIAAELSQTVSTPSIAGCHIFYECRRGHTGDVVNATMDAAIVEQFHCTADLNRVYYGETLAVKAAENSRELMRLD
mgnify:CR=1 FL=1